MEKTRTETLTQALLIAWDYNILIDPEEWEEIEFINHIVEFIREMLPPAAIDEYKDFLAMAENLKEVIEDEKLHGGYIPPE